MQRYLHSDRNPFRSQDVRQKSIDANRASGYAHLTGGNGHGLTPAEKMLSDATGWKPFVIGTGPRCDGIPTHYKLDLANPEARISVEVDGKSHLTKKVAAYDAKKTAWLAERGWIVLRFTNEQVIENVAACADRILEVERQRTTIISIQAIAS
jgi:hypothetical protein